MYMKAASLYHGLTAQPLTKCISEHTKGNPIPSLRQLKFKTKGQVIANHNSRLIQHWDLLPAKRTRAKIYMILLAIQLHISQVKGTFKAYVIQCHSWA